MARVHRPPRDSHHRALRSRAHFLVLRRDHALLKRLPAGLLSSRLLHALPVYSLNLPLRHPASIARSARRCAWIYFLQYRSTIAALEVTVETGRHRHTRLHQGESIDAVLHLLRKVKRSRRTNMKDAPVRLLRVSVLHLSCLWLGGSSDTVIPTTVPPNHLLAEGTYPGHVFLAHVAKAAHAVMSLHRKYTHST